MPSNSINYLYSLLTLTLIGVILTSAFSSYCGVLKQSSESKKLEDVLKMIGSKAAYALMLLAENNATLILDFQMPSRIGDRYYWIRIGNDSSSSWIEGGFGLDSREGEQESRIYLPRKVYASGTFESRYEIARLNCSMGESTFKITLGRKE